MIVVGLNAYHGDVSAVLVRDGQLIAAVEEERFRRIKHCAGFPHARSPRAWRWPASRPPTSIASRFPAIRARTCWRKALFLADEAAGAHWSATARGICCKLRSIPDTIADALGDRSARGPATPGARSSIIRRISPAPSSCRPFDDAAVCAIDGFGDFVSTSWGVRRGQPRRRASARVYFPHSLGLLYLAVTQYLGFMRYGDEFKVMGLAPYGEPRVRRRDLRSSFRCTSGTFELDLVVFPPLVATAST